MQWANTLVQTINGKYFFFQSACQKAHLVELQRGNLRVGDACYFLSWVCWSVLASPINLSCKTLCDVINSLHQDLCSSEISKCMFLGNENHWECSECEAVFPSVLPLTDAISVFPCQPSAKFLSHFSLSSSKWVHSLEKCEHGCMSLARVQGVLAAMVGVIFSVVQCTFTDESICIIISNSFLWSSPISLWASHWKM